MEIILYSAIAATALSALVSFFLAGIRTHSLIESQQTLLHAQQIAESTVLSFLEEADSVLTPASGSSTSLVLTVPTSANNPVSFQIENNALTMTLGANPSVALTPSDVTVTSFTLSRLDGSPPSLRFSLTYQITTGGGRVLMQTNDRTFTLRYE